ncbi:suppressor of fused domain protein [Hahella sp. CR1]|uniref:suppressor of fused domain protein n=1 Tax=Hahella sp. CR1 TaxID=2992807 RepID=UPI00244127DA|nr:suppressor of fused domain protein [Hahella sp. CR1]MDG9669283.1 suppressor of fused domain protein [Hahella sp. CR1]
MKNYNVMNFGEAYYDHYEKYLGKPVDNFVFEDPSLGWKIQVLVYSNVFEGCVTFATVGLSHFSKELKECGELVCVVDRVEEEVPKIIFNTIKTIVLNKMELGWGIGIAGNDKVSARFVNATSKNCVYITDPLPFPEGFSVLQKEYGIAESSPRVYLMLFISQEEYQYFCDKGAKEFESYLERESVDPFNVMRK